MEYLFLLNNQRIFSPIVMVYVLSSVLSFTTFCGSSSPKSDVSASESNFFEAVMLVAFLLIHSFFLLFLIRVYL